MQKVNTRVFAHRAALIWDAVYGKFANEELDFILKQFSAVNGKEVGSVMDIGCGTGRYIIPLAKKGWEVLGIDSSQQMLEILKQKASSEKVQVRAVNTAFEDYTGTGKYDLIVSLYCIIYILSTDSLLSFFQKVKESLGCNGVFVFNFLNLYGYWKKRQTASSMGKVFKSGNVRVNYTTTPDSSDFPIVNVEDYRRLSHNEQLLFDLTSRKIRYYTSTEISLLLEYVGFTSFKFFSDSQEVTDNDIRSQLITVAVFSDS
jgi:2-polyprenyl-3-methyl-5-hydroxy-6-metoxy-1,4-benzoquinol methylase